MGLKEVKQEILEGMKSEVAKIESKTATAIEQMENEAKLKISEQEKVMESELTIELKKLEERRKQETYSMTIQMILEKKREMIDLVMQKAKEELQNENKKYIPKLLAKAKKEISVKNVICRQADASLLKGIKTTTDNQIDGGIIVQNDDTTISIDYTYNTMLSSIKDKHVQEIAKELFE